MVTRARSLIFEISETGKKRESKNKNIRKTVTGAQVFIADCINATKKNRGKKQNSAVGLQTADCF